MLKGRIVDDDDVIFDVDDHQGVGSVFLPMG